MNRTVNLEEAESLILSRMAASRVALLEATRPPAANSALPGGSAHPVASFVTALAAAPRVTMVLALCVSAIVLGPKRTVNIAGRSGVSAWVGSSVKKLVNTAVSAGRG